MTRRLLIVTPTYVAYKVFLRGLSERLVDQGWEVELACSTSNYPAAVEEESSVRQHEIDFPRGQNPWHYLKGARQLARLVREIQPTLIHVHFSSAIVVAALARNIRWPTTLATFQGLVHPMQQGWRRGLYRAAERWSAARMDAAWVLTKDDFRALQGIPSARLQQSKGFGFDQDRFRPDRFTLVDRIEQRSKWNIPKEALVFAYIGRFVQFKGFAATAGAALQITQRHPHVHFVFVGTRDPLHPAGITDRDFTELEGSPQIHFTGWTDDVPRSLCAIDCLVFPSTREGMAVCIMEALGMGVPVMTTAARGCGDLVQNQQNGWIVESNVASVRNQIEELVRVPKTITEASQRAFASSHTMHRKSYIDEQIRIYESFG